MALGVEPNEKDLMSRPPRNPKMGVLTKFECIKDAFIGISVNGRTFTTLTTLQLVHSFNVRSVHQSIFKTGITQNRWMMLAFFISFGLMIIGIYAPGISHWLELTQVGWQSWVITVACPVDGTGKQHQRTEGAKGQAISPPGEQADKRESEPERWTVRSFGTGLDDTFEAKKQDEKAVSAVMRASSHQEGHQAKTTLEDHKVSARKVIDSKLVMRRRTTVEVVQ
ncbi:hypothetical protein G6F43_012552 [Rhizopus delemar]|nr:hypothetical protein G6F43_012552 [Rhizopus delemar]